MAENEQKLRPGVSNLPGSKGVPAGGLKSGNTVGVGRLKSDARLKFATGANHGADHWLNIAEGKRCVPVYNAAWTKRTHYRYPTNDERNYAIAKCCEYGIGKNDKLDVDMTSGGEQIAAPFLVAVDKIYGDPPEEPGV